VSVEPETRRECLEFELRLDAAVSDEVGEHGWGRSFVCPSLPLLWDASWIVIDEPRLGFAEIEALAEDVLGAAGVAHRTALVSDEAAGARVAAEAEAEPGWEVERVHYMTLRHRPERESRVAVAELAIDAIPALRAELVREWVTEDGTRGGEETVEQALTMAARYAGAVRDRWYAAPAGAEPAAACRLLQRDGIGQVEDVATLTRARRRGLAQAIVLAASAASRADRDRLTFLSADAADWPRLMYAKLGFEAIGTVYVVRRRAP
jgi:hypothetical protein